MKPAPPETNERRGETGLERVVFTVKGQIVGNITGRISPASKESMNCPEWSTLYPGLCQGQAA